METLTAIFSRRSIRSFQDRPVEQDALKTLLRAAMYAPSAANEQPWQFIVITDRSRFGKIMAVHPYAAMLRSAPLAILVCGDLGLERVPGNWVLDCSCAGQNLLLAAHDLGLGAVWTGIYPEADRMAALAEICSLPEQIVPLCLIVAGYPAAEAHGVAERFNEGRVRHDSWMDRYVFSPS
jgi:nitroreductase